MVTTNRKSDSKQLSRLYRGELDWIVMKALEKDRNRRYETATGLARDVQRYLNDEPVQACPPSAWYRFCKLTWRNRRQLGFAAGALVLILGFTGSALWSERQKTARQTQTEQTVSAALAQAEAFLKETENQTDHPEHWQATALLARSAVEKAEDLLATGTGTEELADRVRQVRAAVDTSVAESQLLVELERIRLEQASIKIDGRGFNKAGAAPRYALVFQNYGVNCADPAAARRVGESRIREALLAALEDWRRITPDKEERRQLEVLLRAAEPVDGFRVRWWDAARRQDVEALVRLTGELSLEQLTPTRAVELALDLQQVKAWDAAERLLRAAQERNPGDFWVNHDLGRVILYAQYRTRANEAVGFLRAALALRSDSAVVHHNLGIALQILSDYKAAAQEYQAALRIDPNYAEAHMYLGYALRGQGDLPGASREFDEAIREFQERIRMAPNDAWAHYSLGEVLWEKRDFDAAYQEFRSAIQLNPNEAAVHNYLGLALQNRGRLDQAITEFREAIRIDPKFVMARNHLGGALYDKHDYEAAVREWQAGVRIDPQNAMLHSNLAVGLLARGDLVGAAQECRMALHVEPTLALAQSNLAELAANGPDDDKVIQHLRIAIEVEPDLVLVRPYYFNARAWHLATSPNAGAQEGRRAVELAKQASATAAKGVSFLSTLGVAHYRAGDYKAAVTELLKAIELRGKGDGRRNAIDAFFLAMAHGRLGNKEEAHQWYKRAKEWIERNHLIPREGELRRFRAEAEALLHIGDGPKRAK
jgi:tetratricopeptide (TPR) repeat protein